MRSSWSWGNVALLLALALTWPASVQSQPLGSARGGPAVNRETVVIGTTAEPDTLNPLFYDSSTSDAVLYAIFTPDVQVDDAWKTSPLGVEHLPNLRDGSWRVHGEQMTLVWKIKPRRWHDGRPVTCADYVFTNKVARDKRVPLHFDVRAFANRVENVSCPRGADAAEVEVRWNRHVAGAASVVLGFGRFMVPRHVLEPYYRSNPSRLDVTPYGFEPVATIGDGTYRLVEWRRGESLTAEAVEGHPIFGTPRVKRIIWRFLRTQRDLAAARTSGGIDLSNLTSDLTLDEGVALERQSGSPFRPYFAVNGLLEHIDFNLDNPLLRSVHVRRAIAHAINRTQIVQQFYWGRPPVAHSYWPPRHVGFTEAVPKYPYDPARAKALLRDASFSAGPDGVLRDGAGRRLSLELVTTGASPRPEQARLIQEQLRQVGIEVTVLSFPARILFTEILPRRRFRGLAMYAFTVTMGTSSCEPRYASYSIPTEASGWTGGNFTGYRDLEMDEACTAAINELVEEKRLVAIRQVARIYSRDLPALPLFWRLTVVAAKKGLRNFSIGAPFHGEEMWNAPQWYWE